MFIAALFTVAKMWKQPKYLSVDEWINRLWYIHTKEYYSVVKRKLLPYKQNRGKLIDREQADSDIPGGWGVKGLTKKEKNAHGHRQQCGDYGGRGEMQVQEGIRGINGDGKIQ